MLFNELTEYIDEGVGQEVTVVIGDITLVHSTGTSLHNSEYDGVVLHHSAQIFWGICSQWTVNGSNSFFDFLFKLMMLIIFLHPINAGLNRW